MNLNDQLAKEIIRERTHHRVATRVRPTPARHACCAGSPSASTSRASALTDHHRDEMTGRDLFP